MYQNKNIILAIVLFLGSIAAESQNLKADLAAINKAYQKLNKMSLTIELNMFENYQTEKVYFTQSGTMQKDGQNTFQKFEDTECINTPAYSVIVDKEEKEIVYAPRKINFRHDDPALAVNLDSILLFCKSNQFRKLSKKTACYDFLMMDAYPDYNQVSICFDQDTYLVQKIIFYCEEDDISVDNESEKFARSRIEITYKDVNTKPVFRTADFSYEKYLVKSGDKLKLKPELKDFHLTVLSF